MTGQGRELGSPRSFNWIVCITGYNSLVRSGLATLAASNKETITKQSLGGGQGVKRGKKFTTRGGWLHWFRLLGTVGPHAPNWNPPASVLTFCMA